MPVEQDNTIVVQVIHVKIMVNHVEDEVEVGDELRQIIVHKGTFLQVIMIDNVDRLLYMVVRQ